MAMASNKNGAVASPAKEPLFEGLTIVRKNLQSSGKHSQALVVKM
jgi:hypothetical protein